MSGGMMWRGVSSVANVGEEAGTWSGGSSGSSGGVMWGGGGSVTNVGEEAGAWSAGGLEDGCGGDMGGERQPSSWGICRFLAKTAARLLDQVASLSVLPVSVEGAPAAVMAAEAAVPAAGYRLVAESAADLHQWMG